MSLGDAKSLSMLDASALEMLSALAPEAMGGILEVGPYIGGSTLAIEHGNRGRYPHAVIECGGALNHPTLPSTDILADLRSNLTRFGLSDAVTVCAGWSYQRSVRARAFAACGDIGLLFVDADGVLGPLFRRLAPALRDECILALDDYEAPEALAKQLAVRPWIDGHVLSGNFSPIGVRGGTWFGRLNGRAARKWIEENEPLYLHDDGYAYKAFVEVSCVPDSPDEPSRSPLTLSEDGLSLGPPHSLHSDIRTFGKGRYSHWTRGESTLTCIYFSASDNSDPNRNGFQYSAAFDETSTPLAYL